jgi:DNA-binding SARP family transcriptional activator
MGLNLESGRVRGLFLQQPVSGWSRSPAISQFDKPVRVHTLGRFSVQLNAQGLNLSQPRQMKPMSLLQALIACGGREVHSEILAQLLWPDSDGDSAQNNFDVTLHRLRRQFGLNELFLLRDQRLSLNSRLAWVDAWSFERLVNHSERLLQRPPDANMNQQLARCGTRLLHLYQGGFLEREAVQPWMLSMRERLRSKLLRHLLDISRFWASVQDWEQAIRCCQKGLEIEPLAEQLYRQLITCYRDAGQRAEALACFHRCRKTLLEQLQMTPSADTLQLYQSLR